MKFDYKKVLPHVLVIIGFIVAAFLYFQPAFQGKRLQQGDMRNSRANSSQTRHFNKTHDEVTYWRENAFGGMPSYMNSPKYPNLYIKKIDHLIRFLPMPAGFLFLYFLGIYILLLSMKLDYKLSALGGLAFGFSTYLMIIIAVGHNTKAIAIGYMPFVLAGVILSFRKKYVWGGLLLALSMGLELAARHYQITYYLLYIVLIMGVVYFIRALRNKELPEFFKAVGVMVIAVLLGLGANITNFMATHQFETWTTRGPTGLTINKDGTPKAHAQRGGMSYNYITAYSYGGWETLNLFIPDFTGGASTEDLGTDSHTYKYLIQKGVQPARAKQFVENAPTYWGDQPYVASPNYIGACVIFLFIFALYLVRGRLKWWVVGASVLALLLAMGRHIGFLTHFFIDYIPFYDKFRTVSMIQVIPELLFPFLGIVGLAKLFSDKIDKKKKWHALKWSTIITVGFCVFFLLFKTWFLSFSGLHDARYIKNLGRGFVEALKADRKTLFNSSTLRTLIFVLLSAATIFLYLRKKINKNISIGILALLIIVDLVGVDREYLNDSHFVAKGSIALNYKPNSADKQIMKDKGHYRVLDLSVPNFMNSARASAFHNSIGGYSGAKSGRYQDLADFYLNELNPSILNMLNTKYFIVKKNGQLKVQKNPDAFGNAWLVNTVKFVPTVNDEMLTLGKINPRHTAVINSKYKDLIPKTHFAGSPGDTIHLTHFQPNKLVYAYTLAENRLAVFSEMYYPEGWKIDIDGKKVQMAEADYVLRAVYLPKGTHTITFAFQPDIVQEGSFITVITGIITALLFILALGFTVYRDKKRKNDDKLED